MDSSPDTFLGKVRAHLTRYIVHILIAIVLVIATFFLATRLTEAKFKVFYSLDARQNDQQVISVIDHAQTYVYFAIYYFSEDDIADALVRAKARGLVVWGIMDRDASVDTNKGVLAKLIAAGIPVETQKHPDGIMHVKAIVTDNAYASGSYNWTGSANTVNDEVLEVGTDNTVRLQYLNIIKRILQTNQ